MEGVVLRDSELGGWATPAARHHGIRILGRARQRAGDVQFPRILRRTRRCTVSLHHQVRVAESEFIYGYRSRNDGCLPVNASQIELCNLSMSRPQEQVEDQVELEEEAVSGNGEADENMDEVEEEYSELHAGYCYSLRSHSRLYKRLLLLLPRLRGSAGFALYLVTSTSAKYRRTLSKMISI